MLEGLRLAPEQLSNHHMVPPRRAQSPGGARSLVRLLKGMRLALQQVVAHQLAQTRRAQGLRLALQQGVFHQLVSTRRAQLPGGVPWLGRLEGLRPALQEMVTRALPVAPQRWAPAKCSPDKRAFHAALRAAPVAREPPR